MITKGKMVLSLNEPPLIYIVDNGSKLIADCRNPVLPNGEDLANANFIVSACNACKSINEEHPEVVAQSIPIMYETLRMIANSKDTASITDLTIVVNSVLSKIKGGE